MLDGSIVSDVWASPPLAAAVLDAAAALAVEVAAALDAAALPLAALSPAAALLELAAALLEEPEAAPVVAPVAAIRASRSAAVVQVTLVPAELTRGSAAQLERGRLSAQALKSSNAGTALTQARSRKIGGRTCRRRTARSHQQRTPVRHL